MSPPLHGEYERQKRYAETCRLELIRELSVQLRFICLGRGTVVDSDVVTSVEKIQSESAPCQIVCSP